MKKIEIMHEVVNAVRVEVDMQGSSITEYARNFLAIYNNVRDSKELYKVENLSGTNRVFVTGIADIKDDLIEFLSQFGKINGCSNVKMVTVWPNIDYDLSDGWDEKDYDHDVCIDPEWSKY